MELEDSDVTLGYKIATICTLYMQFLFVGVAVLGSQVPDPKQKKFAEDLKLLEVAGQAEKYDLSQKSEEELKDLVTVYFLSGKAQQLKKSKKKQLLKFEVTQDDRDSFLTLFGATKVSSIC